MRARWRLGQLLADMEREQVSGPGRGKVGGKTISQPAKSFLAYLKGIKLDKDTAVRSQRIGTLPIEELEKAFAEAGELCRLSDYAALIVDPTDRCAKPARHVGIIRALPERRAACRWA